MRKISKYDVLLQPIMTEKSNYMRQYFQTYSFFVHLLANKRDIKQAIETLWDVKVLKVNTSILAGKSKARGRTRYKHPNRKKAMVTLAQGDVIDVFDV